MGKHSFKKPKSAKEAAKRVDVVEDIIGTEPLAGTYEARAKQTKMHERERLLVEEWKRKQYEELRKKRADELRKTLEDTTKYHDVLRKIEYIMPYVLEPNAYQYIQNLYEADIKLCQQIMIILFDDYAMTKLDAYVEHIVKTGRGPKNKIKLNYVIRLVRELQGIKPKIEVERDGKRTELGRHIA